MYFVPQVGHAKVFETSIWTPCFQILAKTMPWGSKVEALKSLGNHSRQCLISECFLSNLLLQIWLRLMLGCALIVETVWEVPIWVSVWNYLKCYIKGPLDLLQLMLGHPCVSNRRIEISSVQACSRGFMDCQHRRVINSLATRLCYDFTIYIEACTYTR